MKFEQVFDNYKVVVDFSLLSYNWVITVEKAIDIYLRVTSCMLSSKLSVEAQHQFPYNANEAFELANMYQEALALSQTKNLSPDLLVELCYKEVK